MNLSMLAEDLGPSKRKRDMKQLKTVTVAPTLLCD